MPAAAIRGRFLAYGRIRKFGLGTSRATLVVRDLRTHRVTSLRLTADGRVRWARAGVVKHAPLS